VPKASSSGWARTTSSVLEVRVLGICLVYAKDDLEIPFCRQRGKG
jgi:hypothetical protein